MMPMFNLANLGAARSMETRPVNAPGMWGGQPPIGPFQAMPHPNLGMLGGMGGPPMSGPYQAQLPMQQPMPHPVGPAYGIPGGFHPMPNPGGPMMPGGMGGGMNLGSLQNLMALSQMRQGRGY